ncbi:MAG: ATP-binding protein [Hyphomonadaceae bacterium]|nr:ATP-binding protein [Hyphomonadaceae bacterium]
MTDETPLFNSVAPLRNVSALVQLIERTQNRAASLPGMACFYGPSGYGKTTAAVYAANRFDALVVQLKSTWTTRKLSAAILAEMGIAPRGTVADMVDQISEQLARSGRPLLIDEADFLVARKQIEIVRDIYESSGASVILIGEELLPQKLQAWERVHGRMLDWVPAQPGTAADVDHLAKIYCAGVTLDAALKKAVLAQSGASIRRVCINLDRLAERARTEGRTSLSVSDIDTKAGFFTGEAPAPRRLNIVGAA